MQMYVKTDGKAYNTDLSMSIKIHKIIEEYMLLGAWKQVLINSP